MMSNSKIASLHLTNRDIIWLAKSNFIILNSRKRFSIIFFMLLKTSDDDDHNFHSDNLFSSDCSFSFSVIHMILDLFAFLLIAETIFFFFIACYWILMRVLMRLIWWFVFVRSLIQWGKLLSFSFTFSLINFISITISLQIIAHDFDRSRILWSITIIWIATYYLFVISK